MKAFGCALVLALGCGHRQAPGGVTPNDAIVRVRTNVGDAHVYVDGRFLAPIAALRGGIAVEPGTHRIELRLAATAGRPS